MGGGAASGALPSSRPSAASSTEASTTRRTRASLAASSTPAVPLRSRWTITSAPRAHCAMAARSSASARTTWRPGGHVLRTSIRRRPRQGPAGSASLHSPSRASTTRTCVAPSSVKRWTRTAPTKPQPPVMSQWRDRTSSGAGGIKLGRAREPHPLPPALHAVAHGALCRHHPAQGTQVPGHAHAGGDAPAAWTGPVERIAMVVEMVMRHGPGSRSGVSSGGGCQRGILPVMRQTTVQRASGAGTARSSSHLANRAPDGDIRGDTQRSRPPRTYPPTRCRFCLPLQIIRCSPCCASSPQSRPHPRR